MGHAGSFELCNFALSQAFFGWPHFSSRSPPPPRRPVLEMSAVVVKKAPAKPKTLWGTVEPFVLGGTSGMVRRASAPTGRGDAELRDRREGSRARWALCRSPSMLALSLSWPRPARHLRDPADGYDQGR